MMKKQEKDEIISGLIRDVYASLESHLLYTHKTGLKKPESNNFHKDCVKEYAEMIVKLTKLY
jgi:hypothetical protein